MDTLPPPHIKLLAIDIDGTLLDPHQQITPATKAAVQAARAAGIVVTLATARRYRNTRHLADELGLEAPLILCDGALIVQHPHADVLYTNPLRSTIAQNAVEMLVQQNVQPVIHHIMHTVEETWTGPVEHDDPWVRAYFAALSESIVRRKPYATLCTGQPDPLRVVVFASEEDVQQLTPQVTTLPIAWNTIKRGNYNTAELTIMQAGCTKASGVLALGQLLGIAPTEVMAIGDNTNDIEMLRSVGWGVAMGHASESVKASAHALTTSNAEDGVARAIARYALRTDLTNDSNSFNRETCL